MKIVTDEKLYEIIDNEIPKDNNWQFKVEEIEVDMKQVINVGGESIVVNIGREKVVKIVPISTNKDYSTGRTITVNAKAKKVERAATGKVQSKYVLKPLEFTIQSLTDNRLKHTLYLFGE